MTPMTQIRSEGWNITSLTCWFEIKNPRDISCDLGNINGFLLNLGEYGMLGKGGHMENHEHTPKLELYWFCGCIGNIIRIMVFINYRNKPREELFIICELWELVND